ncbi:uncharacterized protein LOC102709419 [Oryza brachyantha]|uniref:Uncharacterized protein n=1 Tax=Oryza brachyantha TaxID=4533 RepID=J3KY74_ORYBR|nr:uncharacterized protein LOC102709419 [Oryza brachyantha]
MAAPLPGDCEGVGCTSSGHVWHLHRLHHSDDGICSLCSSCVLLRHRDNFCSVCLLFVFPDATPQDDVYDPVVSCSSCGVAPVAVAHRACVPDPYCFVCPACAAAAEGKPFSYTGDPHTPGELATRALVVAARLAHESLERAAAAAREHADRRIREAAVAKKRVRDMLDMLHVVWGLETESPAAAPSPSPTPATPVLIKRTTLKSNAANRDSNKPLDINSIHRPALAFAAAAAAAASSTPLSTPSFREEKKPPKQGRGSANRGAKDDQRVLFGAFEQ